jgi:hypothetical protein
MAAATDWSPKFVVAGEDGTVMTDELAHGIEDVETDIAHMLKHSMGGDVYLCIPITAELAEHIEVMHERGNTLHELLVDLITHLVDGAEVPDYRAAADE